MSQVWGHGPRAGHQQVASEPDGGAHRSEEQSGNGIHLLLHSVFGQDGTAIHGDHSTEKEIALDSFDCSAEGDHMLVGGGQ